MNVETFEVKSLYDSRSPDNSFYYHDDDWSRLAFCFGLLDGSSFNDVGTGPGCMAHLMQMHGGKEINTYDIQKHSQLLLPESARFTQLSITNSSSSLAKADCTVCMEVIEHTEEEFNHISMKLLREATEKRLIVTVPYEESHPLWWHDKPGGHRQSFANEKLQKLFPNAVGTIFKRKAGTDWIFLVEDKRLEVDFRIVSNQEILEILKVNSD